MDGPKLMYICANLTILIKYVGLKENGPHTLIGSGIIGGEMLE